MKSLLIYGTISVVGAGALTGLGLSFTVLSPLVIGGITAAVSTTLFTAFLEWYKRSVGETFSKEDFFRYLCMCITASSIGVGLAATATAVFPGAMLGAGSAALTGAAIGAIAVIAGIFAMENIIEPIAKKVSEHIISPIVEKVSGCFSSVRPGKPWFCDG